MTTLLITGAGSLARATAQALPAALQALNKTCDGHIDRLVVVSRTERSAHWVGMLAAAAAGAIDHPLEVDARTMSWAASGLASLFEHVRPDIVLHTASFQSAWSLSGKTPWACLVSEAGYGVTLPLQAALAIKIHDANRAAGGNAQIVNACYPDLANAACDRLGRRFLSGIGNVALLAEAYRQSLSARSASSVAVLAGHWDVATAMMPPSQRPASPRVWLEGAEITDHRVTHARQLEAGESLNLLNAALTARFLAALMHRADADIHLPGVHGALGGGPARLRGGVLEAILPSDLSADDAAAFHRQRSLADGAVLEGDDAILSPRAAAAVEKAGVAIRARYPLEEIEEEARRLLAIRRFLTT